MRRICLLGKKTFLVKGAINMDTQCPIMEQQKLVLHCRRTKKSPQGNTGMKGKKGEREREREKKTFKYDDFDDCELWVRL